MQKKKKRKTVGSWLGEQPLLGDWLGISRQVVSNCFVHHLFGTYIHITVINIILFFLCCFSKWLLSEVMSSTFFFLFYCYFLLLILFPIPLWGSVSEGLHGAELPVWLNHNTHLPAIYGL